MSKNASYQYPWFHERLIEGLVASQLTIPEVAKRARISKSHAYRIFCELYWPSLPVMFRLESAMGMSRGDLVSEKSPSYGTKQAIH